MPTKTIDVQRAQADLRSLVAQVTAGTEIVLTDGTTPVARIVRADAPPKSRTAGLHPGAIRTSDDFDAPMPEDFWTGSV
jgi:antitoxin (DNA-binding transcriptional repressor) of toxin-antitoxin stability system